jgi:hypothetical protein
MPNTTTRTERAARVEHAQRMLIARGWTPEQSASGLIADDLVREFGYADRRTARRLEAKAARLLRGEAIDAGPGRPREIAALRAGEEIELITVVDGEVIGARRYCVEISGSETWLRGHDVDDMIIRRT